MTTSRIGRGAIVTLGAAASMAWASGAANACDKNPPPPPNPPAPTHHHKADTACKVDDNDVQYAVSDQNGKPVGDWHSVSQGFWRTPDEPTYGYVVQLNPDRGCTGSVDISLASYDTDAAKWEDTKVPQTFVDFSTATLSTKSKDSTTAHLTVKLPNAAAGKCFGQIDLYPGHEKYAGQDAAHPLPFYNGGNGHEIASPYGPFTAWNGADVAGTCSTPGTSTTTSTPSAPPSTPTTPQTTPPTSKASVPPAPPKPSSSASTSTPSTPATTTSPGTPTLAHTGANVGEVSLVALAFFGAGGTVMFASRKAKAAGGVRRH